LAGVIDDGGPGGKLRDLIIIGGGVGGLVTASVAGQLGLRVTLIEKSPRLGGDCLHCGCVPSKTLIRSAKVASLMRRGEAFGLPGYRPTVDLARVTERVQRVIGELETHDHPDRFRELGVEVLFGEARFVNSREVEVKGERLQARRFVLATGSRPAVPPVPGLEEAGYLTNEQIFGRTELPERLAVMGGGPIGVELAQAFQRLGSRVTLFEMAGEILPREDPAIAGELRELMVGEGVDVRTATRVERVEANDGRKCVYARRGEDRMPVEVDEILVAAGRAPNVDGLGLDAAGVRYGSGGVEVDKRLRTSQRHILACGDVCGPYPFTHMAEYQAGVIISNAVFRWPRRVDYRVVPGVTYSDPELARVGPTAAEARERYPEAEVLELGFDGIDRAVAEGEAHGRMQLITRRGRILGATILGPHAGELLHEIVLAMRAGVRIGKLSAAVHAYPTLSQIHRRVVNTHYARRLFHPRTRRLVRWLQRLIP
jgi:pyruvate/2-oxoglutarate dehydrogenase complex dihydrolipoamide dehydrogenase (E3) component